MRIVHLENSELVAKALEKELRQRATDKGPMRVFLPTGKTPLPLYALLRKDPTFWKTHLEGIQIDEFIEPSRPFFSTLKKELVDSLGLNLLSWNINFTAEQATEYVDQTLKEPINLAILGLGPNGHVGFHEPGTPKDFKGGKLKVTKETQLRCGAKTQDVYTFGVASFLKTKEIFLVVTGSEKKEIFAKFKDTKPTDSLPATLLKAHSKFTIFTDLP